MINATEARSIVTQVKSQNTSPTFWDIMQITKADDAIRKAAKKELYYASIHVMSKRPYVLSALEREGFVAYYWRSKWRNGLRLIIQWDK